MDAVTPFARLFGASDADRSRTARTSTGRAEGVLAAHTTSCGPRWVARDKSGRRALVSQGSRMSRSRTPVRLTPRRRMAGSHTNPSGPAETASAMEFVIEALHQQSLVGKDRVEAQASYSDIMGSVLGSIGRIDDDDDDFEDYRRRFGG